MLPFQITERGYLPMRKTLPVAHALVPNFVTEMIKKADPMLLQDLQEIADNCRARARKFIEETQAEIHLRFASQSGLLAPLDWDKLQMRIDVMTFDLLSDFFAAPAGKLKINALFNTLGGESAFEVAAQAAKYNQNIEDNKETTAVTLLHLGDVKGLKIPQVFTDGCIEAFAKGQLNYTAAPGLLELRKSLSTYLNDLFGINATPNEVSVCAAKSVLQKALQIVLDTGDGIAYSIPGYPIYESVAKSQNAKLSPYTFNFQEDGQIDLKSVEAALKKGVKLFVLNDDNNPTGGTMSEETAKKLHELLNRAEYRDVMVMFDVAYFRIRMEGQSNILPMMQDLYDQNRAIIAWTFSKEGGATGARLGAVVMPRKEVVSNGPVRTLIDAFNKLIGNQESCPPEPLQRGLMALLKTDESLRSFEETIGKNVATLKERRDALCQELSEIEGIKFIKPKAGFYVLTEMTEHFLKSLGYTLDQAEQFRLDAMKEAKLSFCAGRHFGATEQAYPDQRFFRFAVSGVETGEIKEAMGRFKAWIEGRQKAVAFLKDKTVTVIGSGPIGQFAADAMTGVAGTTTLVSRHSAERFQKEGIYTHFPVERHTHPEVVSSAARIIEKQDVIYIASKRSEDEETAKEIAHLVKPGTQIICLQNGVDASKYFEKKFPEAIVSQCVISVQIKEEANENGRRGLSIPKSISYIIGSPNREAAETAELSLAMRSLGYTRCESVSPAEVQILAYQKLIKNLANFAGLELAMQGKGLTYADVLASTPETATARENLKAAIQELLQIAESKGVQLRNPGETTDACFNRYYAGVLTYVATTHICTTVTAFRKGEEIEDLLSEIFAGEKPKQLSRYVEMLQDYNANKTPHELTAVVQKEAIPALLEMRLSEVTQEAHRK